jgi:PTH1 family peptidyl-tRNA hydrolase
VKLVVGLGNPGSRYASTRHNVGFRVLARVAERNGIALDQDRFGGRFGRGAISAEGRSVPDVGLLAPLTYMNLSGESVAEALLRLPVGDRTSDLLVVFDDVDLPFGRLRIRASGGAGGHRGLASVIEHVGDGGFPRLRFGVDRPPPGVDTVEHVLSPFSQDELERLDALLSTAARAVESVLVEGVVPAMDRFNPETP